MLKFMRMPHLLLPPLFAWMAAAQPAAVPVPVFADAARRTKLESALPAVERAFEKFYRERGTPGLAFGMVVDGQLVLAKGLGLANRESNTPVTAQTRFRIASMTKSFTALAILKLRDEGKLSLEDPVAKWIPEIAKWTPPTRDSPALRVRHLMTHSAGFPEDNPWGDQQLGISEAELDAWLKKGVPFSTSPGTAYEYSNYGFALLGRIVTKASGTAYRTYVEKEILLPLGMADSTLEPAEAPKEKTAVGYRRTGDMYSVEPSLRHGGFGAMGGLVTTLNDLARYVAFQLDAYPPRDDADRGPVRRASRREMQTLSRHSGIRGIGENPVHLRASGYGFGLGVTHDCAFGHIVSHGGGLPGFGSNMTWLPEHGIGFLSMANLTYAGPSSPVYEALEALQQAGALEPRVLGPSPVLVSMQMAITSLWQKWDAGTAQRIAAMNLYLDQPAEARRLEMERLKREMGACRAEGPVMAENWLRGTFLLACDHGKVDVEFTLAPSNPPAIQHLSFTAARHLTPELRAVAEKLVALETGPAEFLKQGERYRASYGRCRLGDTLTGDGDRDVRVEARCERGKAHVEIRRDAEGRVIEAVWSRAGQSACVP